MKPFTKEQFKQWLEKEPGRVFNMRRSDTCAGHFFAKEVLGSLEERHYLLDLDAVSVGRWFWAWFDANITNGWNRVTAGELLKTL